MKLIFNTVSQIMGMGGPYLSSVLLDNIELQGKFIEQKVVLNEQYNLLLLVEAIEFKQMFIKKVKFAINVFDLNTNFRYTSKEEFHYLFIDQMEGNEIVYFEAFHNNNNNEKRSMLFVKSNFDLVGEMFQRGNVSD